MERVVVYVDGFNLYFRLMEAGLKKYRWLDIYALAKNILKDNQSLVAVKYFTSRVNNDPEKQKRQTTHIEALQTTGICIFYGHYQNDNIECKICGNTWKKGNEKMTDVNIATNLIIDAYMDIYDTAILISGDSDLVPPIRSVHKYFHSKRVVIAFPPRRKNNTVAIASKGNFIIGRKKLIESQLPLTISKKDGFILEKPKEWY
jgi:uncharacterized LabA/DUF88 family protein